jgi:hypothetical protein
MRWAGHITPMDDIRHGYRVLIGKPEGKTPLRKPRPSWENNIKKYLK